MTTPQEKLFVVGQRFQLSKLGRERCPRLAGKVGTIVLIRNNSISIIVLFDGNKQARPLHRDYIEPLV